MAGMKNELKPAGNPVFGCGALGVIALVPVGIWAMATGQGALWPLVVGWLVGSVLGPYINAQVKKGQASQNASKPELPKCDQTPTAVWEDNELDN